VPPQSCAAGVFWRHATPTDDSARMKLFLESLGCARNLVDSEVMLGRLRQAGWRTVDPGGGGRPS
jgi:hypothetical protein